MFFRNIEINTQRNGLNLFISITIFSPLTPIIFSIEICVIRLNTRLNVSTYLNVIQHL